jgi:hypothetical protein
MTGLRTFTHKWRNRPSLRVSAGFLVLLTATAHCFATGYYEPRQYLDDGGKKVDGSPQFYWELEVKRLARDFKPAEKRVPGESVKKADHEAETPRLSADEATAEADRNDFVLALKEGGIKPSDPTRAAQQHEAARQFLSAYAANSPAAPDEFASEFADYHKGAIAYRLGKEHWTEARTSWEALLKRPESERHYRTVWAAFMLGKMALKSGDPEAVTWFRRTRELAKQGFADSLGMAADSYGWEGRSEWKQGHSEAAARLFLTQLALGDESAVVSLKALIPDREPVGGMLNYGPEPEDTEKWTPEQKQQEHEKIGAALRAMVKDSILRRLETAHILATEARIDPYAASSENQHVNRCARWLSIITEAKVDKIEEGEYIGWVAYTNGDYKGAARWLELGNKESPGACWLRAKLQRRAGKLEDALKSMAQAWQGIHGLAPYTGWTHKPGSRDETFSYVYTSEGYDWSFEDEVSGDLASLHLARADFIEALDIFLKGELWTDAAFIAERVLTIEELRKYVDQLPAPEPRDSDDPRANAHNLRWLLGRRLVREDRYAEAARYLPPPYDKLLETYVGNLKVGTDSKLSKEQRAKAFFAAAWLARHEGMEIMGTEVAPDVFNTGGDFEITDLAKQRLSGRYERVDSSTDGDKKRTEPLVLKPTKQELQRLAKNKIVPDIRFHYRVIAGALALKAAALLRDNTEELADVVNTAGLWVKERDNKLADSYYLILVRRAGQTAIGRAAKEKRWFVDKPGPWTDRETQEHDALLKGLGLGTE